MEISVNGADPVMHRWKDILVQGGSKDDIQLKDIGVGKSTDVRICFDELCHGLKVAVELPLGLRDRPRFGGGYTNIGEMRRAFLMSVMRARPDLRIDDDMFSLCGIDPRTLEYSPWRKVCWLLMYSVSMALFVAVIGVAIFVFLPRLGAEASAGRIVASLLGCIVLALAVSIAFLVLSGYCFRSVFGVADDPEAVQGRQLLLGVRSVERRMADDFVRAPASSATTGEFLAAVIKQPSIATPEILARFDLRNWRELLNECPQFVESCPKEFFPKLDWSALLRQRPELATACPWDVLAGWQWAEIVSEQPRFAERADWGKFDGEDWSTLLAARPEFAERADWSRLDGGDWSDLLVERPEFAQHADWGKFDGEDWAELLAEQPQFAAMKTATGTA
jgi:hypothetical protein